MKEHPILMSAPMVKAILDGRKTQTRRVLKDQPAFMDKCYYTAFRRDFGGRKCPYGQVGDRLWVKETFVLESDLEYIDDIKLPTDRPIKTVPDDGEWGEYHLIPHYSATEPEPNIVSEEQDSWDDRTRWKPSIFMPRWASRITLEITDIKVQRLWEITEDDCVAEGLKLLQGGIVSEYAVLWNKINGKKHHWKDDPWIWVIEFKRIV